MIRTRQDTRPTLLRTWREDREENLQNACQLAPEPQGQPMRVASMGVNELIAAFYHEDGGTAHLSKRQAT